jgi:excisionase family DNA binding protein
MKNLNVIEQLQSLLEQAQENALENEKPLDFESARRFLGVSCSTLYKMTFLKKIPFSKPGGKKVYFKKSDLIKWMNSNPVKSVEEIEDAAVNYMMNK